MQSGLLSRLMGRPAEVKTLPVTAKYARAALRWEMAKSAMGSAGGLAILFGLNPSVWVAVPVGIGTALFAIYGVHQHRRGGIQFEISEERISSLQRGRRIDIPWSALERFKLNFYAFGRKSEQGTLVLYVHGGGERIKLDSAADEFATALFYAAQMARNRELTLDSTTIANLDQLGL